jgi:hypothetical protein
MRLRLPVQLPETDGRYALEVDMLQEGVTWFASKGSTAARLEWSISGGTGTARAAPGASPGDLAGTSPSFRERHPHLISALRALRLGVVYRAAGELMGAAKREAVWSWRQAWRRPPVMDMNFLPRSEVVEVLGSSGARILEVDHVLLPGALHSYRYWATR